MYLADVYVYTKKKALSNISFCSVVESQGESGGE